jgi:YD repeat-containing protein
MSSTWSGEIACAVARTYDGNGWLTSRSVNGAHTAAFGYDDDGLLTAAGALTVTRDPATGLVTGTSLGDVTTTMAYNGFGEPESASASFDGTPLYQVSYTRDQLGRITDKVETIQGVTTTWTYRYDPAGRLEEVDQNAALYAEYGFDDNGNRTSYSGFWGTTTGVYDAQDRMTSYGGATYTYTANGELLTKTVGADVTTYDYDVFGSLRAATLPDGTEIEYVIDAQHRRIGKKVNGVLVQGLFYKDQLNPIAELNGAGAMVSRFVYGTRPHVPEYMVKGGVTYRILRPVERPDGLHSVEALRGGDEGARTHSG